MNKLKSKFNKKFVIKILTRSAFIFLYVIGLFALQTSNVFAASDPVAVISNLENFIASLVKTIGVIILIFGIVQVGMSLKSHDPSQRANGIMTVAGGVVIAFAPEIVKIITG